jgi:hypothetical protein
MGPGGSVRSPLKERVVTLLYAVGGILALVITVYLFAALLYPEYFA